jgi:hypothetical protein
MTKKNTKLVKQFQKVLVNTRRYRLLPNTGTHFHTTDRHRLSLVAAMASFAGMSHTEIRTASKDTLASFVAKKYGFLTKTVTGKLGYYNFNTKFPRQHAARFLNRYI